VLKTHANQRTFATDKPDESLLDSFSPERMIEELQTLEKMSATIKRTKTGDSDSPGVSCTVAGNGNFLLFCATSRVLPLTIVNPNGIGRLDKVKIDDDLAGDLQTIERLTVEAYLGAREAVVPPSLNHSQKPKKKVNTD